MNRMRIESPETSRAITLAERLCKMYGDSATRALRGINNHECNDLLRPEGITMARTIINILTDMAQDECHDCHGEM